MCLSTIDEKTPKSRGYGWKVFTRVHGMLFSWLAYCRGPHYLVGQWCAAKEEKIYAGSKLYTSGFHVFKVKKDAEIFSLEAAPIDGVNEVRQVEYSDAHTAGLQNHDPCVVARKMRILRKGTKPR